MSGLKAFCSFDSYMIPTEDLQLGEKRLLEVTRRLQFPTHANIRALITSDDVIHSWAVPSFAVKVDAIPGRINEAWINVFLQGVYYGQCSEICGVNHSFMPIVVEVFDTSPDPKEIIDGAKVLNTQNNVQ